MYICYKIFLINGAIYMLSAYGVGGGDIKTSFDPFHHLDLAVGISPTSAVG